MPSRQNETDRFKKGNKDRRNQPPGGTPEVCVFFSKSLPEVNLVCCNHSILESVGIAQKRPNRAIRSALSIDVALPIADNQKESCDKQVQKTAQFPHTAPCPMLTQDGVNWR